MQMGNYLKGISDEQLEQAEKRMLGFAGVTDFKITNVDIREQLKTMQSARGDQPTLFESIDSPDYHIH